MSGNGKCPAMENVRGPTPLPDFTLYMSGKHNPPLDFTLYMSGKHNPPPDFTSHSCPTLSCNIIYYLLQHAHIQHKSPFTLQMVACTRATLPHSQAHACIPKQTTAPRMPGNTITSSQQCKHWKRNSKPGSLGDIYRMYIVYITRAGIW